MNRREELQLLLEGLIGSKNVYFQPPETVKMAYPCIVYSRGVIESTDFANDKPYNWNVRFSLIIIDKDPDSIILDKVAALPMCRFERHYTSNNLNHDVYNLYY